MTDLINIHPADELAALREEIKQMQAREAELRDILLTEGADLYGEQYTALLIPSQRETVDKNALIADLGRAAVLPYLKVTHIKSVKVVPNKE